MAAETSALSREQERALLSCADSLALTRLGHVLEGAAAVKIQGRDAVISAHRRCRDCWARYMFRPNGQNDWRLFDVVERGLGGEEVDLAPDDALSHACRAEVQLEA